MKEPEKRLRIVEMRTENFKRIEVAEITPSGDVVIVSGANAAGKSSVIDSIFAALQARAMLKDIPQPVREGKDKATITLNLGDYVVVRTIKPDKTTKLKVTTGEGVPVKSPQSVLDGLLGSLSIDPSVFIRLKAGDQVKTLVELVDTDGFLAKNDGQHDAWYNHRTQLGRTRDQHQAVLDAMPKPDLPDEKPDVDALKVQAEERRTVSQHKERLKGQKDDLIGKQNSIIEHIAAMQEQLDEVKGELASTANELETMLPIGPGDVEVAEEAWRQAVEQLAEYDKVDTWNAANEAHATAEGEYVDATEKLEIVKTNRQAWLAKATLPVEGLSFDFDVPCVTYNGIPLAQASTSEQLKVGTAIAMAQNPELRVIRVRDGNCLDKASFAMMAKMAADKEFQLWIEKVDETGDIGIYIEDGKVVAVDGEPVQK